MKIASEYKLTFDPAGLNKVLLDYDELVDRELQWPLRRALSVTAIAESDHVFLRPGGNGAYQIGFTVERTAATDALSRVAMINHLTDWVESAGKGVLKVEIRGVADRSYQFASSYITDFEVGRVVDSGAAEYEIRVGITATNWNKVLV